MIADSCNVRVSEVQIEMPDGRIVSVFLDDIPEAKMSVNQDNPKQLKAFITAVNRTGLIYDDAGDIEVPDICFKVYVVISNVDGSLISLTNTIEEGFTHKVVGGIIDTMAFDEMSGGGWGF